MHRLYVKICGLRTAATVEAAVAAGADAVGFVFAESPRRIRPTEAAALAARLPATVAAVAVMRHPGPADWAAVVADFAPAWLQADAASFPGLPLGAVKRLPVYRDVADFDADAAAREELVLFEAARSGSGEKADWGRAAALARRTRVILAGGLTPDNVAEAILRVRPFGVDVSSGVESAPGVKDPARIAAFVAAARRAGEDG